MNLRGGSTMKMRKPRILLYMVLFLLLEAVSVRAEESSVGDVNRDGLVDAADAALLREYLVGDPAAVYEAGADYNGDRAVDLKDLVLLERFLGINAAEITVTPAPTPDPREGAASVRQIVYGKSELGRDLVCTVLEPAEFERTILVNFAIHGFEDWYDHDAQVLVDTAELVISHFREADDMHRCRLLVVSCANPDGLADGYTKDGFGRCNANGIDLNRDFDAAHYAYTSARNYTPYAFSASESRALRDLVWAYRPDVVLDCHGWENCTIGDSELAKVFYEEEGLVQKVVFSDNAHGYFSYWAHQQGALALLVEFANPSFDKNTFVSALDRLVTGDYETDNGIYTADGRFSAFSQIQAYPISTGNIPVYVDIGGEQGGTIYGSEDLCTIERIYLNGWLRVRYPIPAGYKEAYCRQEVFMEAAGDEELPEIHFFQDQTVYRRKDLTEKLGSVYQTDTAYLVTDTDDAWQILYPLDSGGWKLGWVSAGLGSVSAAGNVKTADMTWAGNGYAPETGTTGNAYAVDPAADGSIHATSTAGLSYGTVRFDQEGILEVPLLLKADDLTAIRLWIMTDEEVLSLESVENGSCLRGMTVPKDPDGSMCCILWADSLKEEDSGLNGILARVCFSMKENTAAQQTEVTFLVSEGDALTFSLEEAAIPDLTVSVDLQEEENNVLFLPPDLTRIDAEAFMGGAFQKVVLPDGMKEIGERAFADCLTLKTMRIPASTTIIEPDVLSGIPEGFTILGERGSYAEDYAKSHGFAFLVQ